MTKKHFQRAAALCQNILDPRARQSAAAVVTILARENNHAFDAERFAKAAGVPVATLDDLNPPKPRKREPKLRAGLAAAAAFFKANAGYSYDPKTEMPEKGRERCAWELARVEAEGKAAGLSFEWEYDPFGDSSDFSDEQPAWALWACVCHNQAGAVVASLTGIDFGRDGSPWGDHYRRVVEAELAAQALEAATA